MRTLLLDNTYFPVKVIGWQKAMILLLTGRAEVVDEYGDLDIRSPNQSFKLPKILRLFGRHRVGKHVQFSRYNVYYRDNFKCQYCAEGFSYKDLTFDHVIPRSKGGDTCWENIVTCCRKCNTKKGNKLPDEARMNPITSPRKPNWTPQLCLKLKESDPQEWWDWFPSFKKAKAS